ncbi:MAG: BatA domain-containing protein, partial [Defluviicoccus sp.]|nr:BatA domain-containing protein [Defluviicoccus sp.]
MAGLSALGFAAPWFLLAGLVLPLIWWLLRVTPPAPRLVAFPPIRLVLGLRSPEESPARTPLWLIVLRCLIAALIILALAGPVLNPTAGLHGSGPLILIVDNGWASARDWQDRVAAWNALLDRAERDNRPVRLATPPPGAPRRPGAGAPTPP